MNTKSCHDNSMKTHHIRSWLALVEAGTIRSAAKALHLSQAAVTKAIKELEADLGAALIIRSTKGIVLTKQGEALTTRLRLVQRQMQLAREDIIRLQGGDQVSIAIGVTPMVTMTTLAPVLQRFRNTMPRASISVFEGLAPAVEPAVRCGEIDFALVLLDPNHVSSDMLFEPLSQLSYIIIGRKDHPLKNAHHWDQIRDQEWLMNLSVGSHNQRFLEALDAHGLPRPNKIIRSDAFGVMWNLLLRSDALIACPASMLQTSYAPDFEHIDVPLPMPCSYLGILSSSHTPLSLAAETLALLFREENARQP
ncbi:LysR substrate-binding domain-containing protein [Alcaligenes phenolicus]